MQSVWRILPADPPRAHRLSRAAGVHPVTAQLLLNRGIGTAHATERFLTPRLSALGDPHALPDMSRALERLRQAVAQQEPILIFSDSDVDGLTASVIVYEALRELGAVVRVKTSNRLADGYGLPEAIVRQVCRSSTRLVILIDCGTNQPDAVERLARAGIETIIIDHHVPLTQRAHPHALVNAHCHASSAYRELCSAGLALKVAQGLLDDTHPQHWTAALDLAALGTLADCSLLVGDNRILISEGLSRIVRSHRPGLARLCDATSTKSPEPDQIIRRLVPRLNAAGRLGDPLAVWSLLLSDTSDQLEDWLAQSQTAHETTRQLHRQITAEAQEQVNRLHFKDQFVMVVSREGWHQGLMGPLASQLTQRYGRPAIALAMNGARGIGSGRSVPLFNLLKALEACQDLLVAFGGHAQACGLTVDRKHLERFREMLNGHAQRSLGRQGLVKTRTADVELSLASVDRQWVTEAQRFAPFGNGNPRPMIVIRSLTIERRSPQVAVLSDGSARVVAKGVFPEELNGRGGILRLYDMLASPTIVGGELVLMVSDVKASAAPWEPGRTSSIPYTHASGAPSHSRSPWRFAGSAETDGD